MQAVPINSVIHKARRVKELCIRLYFSLAFILKRLSVSYKTAIVVFFGFFFSRNLLTSVAWCVFI